MSLTLIRERNRRTNEIESERVLCSVHLHEQYPEGVQSDRFVIVEASEAPWGFGCEYDGLAPEFRREDDLPCSPSL